MFNCYNENSHICDGRCQGATDCPMTHNVNVSKRIMKLYIKDTINQKEEWDKLISELHQDKEYLKEVEQLILKLKFKIVK